MGARKALLIVRLPAVQEDIRILESALQAAGYELARCPQEAAANAGKLDDGIRAFSSAGGPDACTRLLHGSGPAGRQRGLDRPGRHGAQGGARHRQPALLDRSQQDEYRVRAPGSC